MNMVRTIIMLMMLGLLVILNDDGAADEWAAVIRRMRVITI